MVTWIRQAAARVNVTVAAELGGLAAIVAGVWMVFPPAALMLAGVGAVLWAQKPRRP